MSSSYAQSPGDAGRTIADPNTGEEITFLETSEETGGDRAVMRIGLAPGTVVPPHAHPFEEAFECLEGRVSVSSAGETVDLGPGESVTVAVGKVHGISNPSDTPSSVRVVAKPGAIAEHSLRAKFVLSRDGLLPQGGGPPKNLLLGAVVLHRAGMYFPPLPRWMFRALIAFLAALGRWRGRERYLVTHYPEYARFLELTARPRQAPTAREFRGRT